eukprot:Trichotokara_eunicae@DN3617_c0_g1_i1.p1
MFGIGFTVFYHSWMFGIKFTVFCHSWMFGIGFTVFYHSWMFGNLRQSARDKQRILSAFGDVTLGRDLNTKVLSKSDVMIRLGGANHGLVHPGETHTQPPPGL